MKNESLSSIKKSITILDLISTPPCEYTVAEISKRTGIHLSTVYRTIEQLEEEGMVAISNETKKYRIGPHAYRIGNSYIYRNNYMQSLEELVHEISEKVKESVGMAIFDQGNIVSIIESEIKQPMKLNDIPGKYFPVNKGTYGKCIMAFLPEEYIEEYLNTHTFEKTLPATITEKDELLAEYEKIRRQGYCNSVEESRINVAATGIPLFDHKGKIWGSLGIAFFMEDNWEQKLEDVREIALSYKERLEQYLP